MVLEPLVHNGIFPINLNWWVYRILCPSKNPPGFTSWEVLARMRMMAVTFILPKRHRLLSRWQILGSGVAFGEHLSRWVHLTKTTKKNDKVVWWLESLVFFFPMILVSCWEVPFFEDLVSACRKGRLFSLRWLVIQAINLMTGIQLSMSSTWLSGHGMFGGSISLTFGAGFLQISMARFVFFSRCGKIIKIWGVSKNRGTPKGMVKIMENPIF